MNKDVLMPFHVNNTVSQVTQKDPKKQKYKQTNNKRKKCERCFLLQLAPISIDSHGGNSQLHFLEFSCQ